MVDTVDCRSPAGEDQKAKKEKVEVTHVKKAAADDGSRSGSGSGGVMAQTVEKVGEKVHSAKEAITSHTQDPH